ncbi:MAG: glycosyltransferase family A protein [Ruegeria sp.]
MALTAEQRTHCRSQIEPWRTAMTPNPISGTPTVVFSIPLISEEKAGDWEQVCANLAKTVETLRRQTNPHWKAIICSQTKPEGVCFDNQVLFLPFAEKVEGNDKRFKRRLVAGHCLKAETGDIYLFNLDADDFAHPELVDYMVETRDPSGYLVERGYMYDIAARTIAPLHRAQKEAVDQQERLFGLFLVPWRLNYAFRRLTGRNLATVTPRLSKMRSFGSTCGSCVAWRLDCSGGDKDAQIVPQINHRLIRHANEDGLMNLDPVPFSAMMYVVGHGENDQDLIGRLHHKTRYIDEFKLSESETRQVLRTFGVS